MIEHKTEVTQGNFTSGGDGEKREAMLRDQRGKSLAAMGLVSREGDRFRVTTAAFKGREHSFEVWRDEAGLVRCSCPEFGEMSAINPAFRCEHILAVKHSLTAETSSGEKTSVATSEAESPLGSGTPEIVPLVIANLLRTLRQPIEPRLIKSREGWPDRNGQIHMVEYVEWHTVADILDRVTPNWSHSVRSITQIGDLVAVVASITIENVTREGVGTGSAESETGIKKAEHDALKRAAVKFGIARDLYQRESDVMEGGEGSVHSPRAAMDPLAKTLSELVTPKQLRMIHALGREMGCDVEAECQTLLRCGTEGLSKHAASSLIDHLKRKQQETVQERENVELEQAS
ncbi:MAG: RAD52 family DNA repair protein [Acidobacteria bacterium]|nr:RAD52 family DNA repair protein [Acidobacteriota bacterium]